MIARIRRIVAGPASADEAFRDKRPVQTSYARHGDWLGIEDQLPPCNAGPLRISGIAPGIENVEDVGREWRPAGVHADRVVNANIESLLAEALRSAVGAFSLQRATAIIVCPLPVNAWIMETTCS